MIVLLVFSIGVLAVLRLILHNMETMSQLEAKSTATLLAKE
jgi:Tfp pilus assembly protein PilV